MNQTLANEARDLWNAARNLTFFFAAGHSFGAAGSVEALRHDFDESLALLDDSAFMDGDGIPLLMRDKARGQLAWITRKAGAADMKKSTQTLHLESREGIKAVDVEGYLHADSGLFIHRTVTGAGGLQRLTWTVTHLGTSNRVRQARRRADAVVVCKAVANALEIAGFDPRAWAASPAPFDEFKGSLEPSTDAMRALTRAGLARNA